jgi:preprotein translocase subunit YajC
MTFFNLFLDATPNGQGNLMQTFVMVGVALVFFYFILLRPEQKRKKMMEQQRSSMKIGDRIVSMNLVGKLHQIHDQTVTLSMLDGSKVEVLKLAITDVKSE